MGKDYPQGVSTLYVRCVCRTSGKMVVFCYCRFFVVVAVLLSSGKLEVFSRVQPRNKRKPRVVGGNEGMLLENSCGAHGIVVATRDIKKDVGSYCKSSSNLFLFVFLL